MSVRVALTVLLAAAIGIRRPWRHDHRCADCHARLAQAEAETRQMCNVIALSRYARRRA